MGKASRVKGASGEREAAKEFNNLFPGVEAKRGIAQTRHGGKEGADLSMQPNLHIEVKRQKKVSIKAAMKQAEDDAQGTGGTPGTVTREDGKPWYFCCRLEDLPKVVSELSSYLPGHSPLVENGGEDA
ncbi:hypothetical protein [Bremerella sp. P1]|uniref:hypothetical protein n=1 Tax=Bremerella sp. P1 TaxID=3026424 RepID=UPI0023688315|nr:hypothetical protein [Bremerella sp. P1]WDI44757.1 hypothetical protein PSR63_12505 [Bremerella sp. P1]